MKKNILTIFLFLFSILVFAQNQYEPNNNFGEATPLEFGESYSAAIQQNSDRDYYKFYVPVESVITAQVFNVAWPVGMVITLYDDDNLSAAVWTVSTSFGGQDIALIQKTCQPGFHYIRLEDTGNSNSSQELYTLIVTMDSTDIWEYEGCNDDFANAKEIIPSVPIQAAINGRGDTDFFSFTVSVESVVYVGVTNVSPYVDMDLFLYSAPNFNSEIALSTNSSSGVDAGLLKKICTPGVYYIQLKDGGNGNGYDFQLYDLVVLIDSTDIWEYGGCNDDFADAKEIIPSVPIQAAINGRGDTDFFSFTVSVESVVYVGVTNVSPYVDMDIFLYDAPNSSSEIALSTNSSSGVDAGLLKKICTPGVYYIQLKDGGNGNGYDFQLYGLVVLIDSTDIWEYEGCNDDFANAKEITLGEPIEAAINSWGDLDFFSFTVPVESVVYVGVTNVSQYVDMDIFLYDAPNFNSEIASATNSSSGSDAGLLKKICTPGVYYIQLKDGGTGNGYDSQLYNLEVVIDSTDVYECNDTPDDAIELEVCSDTIYAAINAYGDYDYFQFEVPANVNVSISVKNIPSDIDMYLELTTPSNNTLTDQGNNGANVEINDLNTIQGTYLLRLSDFGDNNFNAGLYQLCISIQPEISFSPQVENICIDDAPVQLSGGEPSGGMYSGIGVDSLSGIFNPTIAGVGTHEVTFTYTDIVSACTANVSAFITVHDLPTVVFVLPNDTVMVTETTLVLSGGVPNGGAYTGANIIDGTFYPNNAGVGTYDILYTYTDSYGCVNSSTTTITVIQTTAVSLPFENQQIVVFPNPFNNRLTINTNNFSKQKVEINIYDLFGRKIFSEKKSIANQLDIETDALPQGLFILEVIVGQKIYTTKILKE